ncbi:hypothetical protein ACFE04_023128 [Oxalis oulophora]
MKRKIVPQASQSNNNVDVLNNSNKGHISVLDMDWISNLPDALILQILSNIDTKLAVKTCVLSKRWSHLWEHLPVLNISKNSFLQDSTLENFVISFLKKHKACTVDSLNFQYHRLAEFHVSKVVDHAVSRHARHVRLTSTLSTAPCFLHSRVLSSKSMRSLNTENHSFQVAPTGLNFPSLKTLRLHKVWLCREGCKNIAVDIFSSCVNLENLELTECIVESVDFVISTPQLVNLKISFMRFIGLPITVIRKLIVSAPRLTSFELNGPHFGLIFDLENCPRFHTVSIHARVPYLTFIKVHGLLKFREIYFPKYVNLFKALRKAKSLNISMETIEMVSETLPLVIYAGDILSFGANLLAKYVTMLQASQLINNGFVIYNPNKKQILDLEVDLLNNLSNNLILHILRYIDIKLAVQTCPAGGGIEDELVNYVFGKTKATQVAHLVWKRIVKQGDTVIDATCGNGYDTLALLKLVADHSGRARVYAFDIQEDAINATSSFLDHNVNPNEKQLVELFPICHSRMEQVVPSAAPVRLVAFNLGYLPGGEKSLITESKTTLLALDAAKRIVLPGGLISLVVYVGHPGGREEFEAIEGFAAGLSVDDWVCYDDDNNIPTKQCFVPKSTEDEEEIDTFMYQSLLRLPVTALR